ncbi:hypothetical protein ADUPG1_010428, partial [Aduncisulcus paluster]
RRGTHSHSENVESRPRHSVSELSDQWIVGVSSASTDDTKDAYVSMGQDKQRQPSTLSSVGADGDSSLLLPKINIPLLTTLSTASSLLPRRYTEVSRKHRRDTSRGDTSAMYMNKNQEPPFSHGKPIESQGLLSISQHRHLTRRLALLCQSHTPLYTQACGVCGGQVIISGEGCEIPPELSQYQVSGKSTKQSQPSDAHHTIIASTNTAAPRVISTVSPISSLNTPTLFSGFNSHQASPTLSSQLQPFFPSPRLRSNSIMEKVDGIGFIPPPQPVQLYDNSDEGEEKEQEWEEDEPLVIPIENSEYEYEEY